MILTLDVGNTNVTATLFKGLRPVKKLALPTGKFRKPGGVSALRRSFAGRSIRAVVICSVVPGIERKLSAELKKAFKVKPIFLGRDIKVPIRNLYKKPGQVGQDRLVNAYAAHLIYGSPAIIIDFGTAVTFDVTSIKGAYLGGVITPGISLSLDVLSERTALLPRVELKTVTPLLGRDTPSSIAGGMIHGYGAMCDGLVGRFRKKLKKNFRVIATGGNAALISKVSASINVVDQDLTSKGILLSYLDSSLNRASFQKNKKNKEST